MDTSVHRFDFAPITRSETTPEGYLRVWSRTARVGTQLYRRADGSQVREYRPLEEVSNPESLATFGMKPATWLHPPTLLDAENTKDFQIGYSGSQVRFNDGFVEVALVVTDKDKIERIKRGDATEVSAGYRVDFDPTPGITPEGESYDGVQRNIRVNHIAIVPRGRAGPEVRLLLDRMDAADAVAIDPDAGAPAPQPLPPESPTMATVKLDGLEIELPADAATAVQSYVRDKERQLSALTTEREQLQTKIDTLQDDLEATVLDKETADERVTELEKRVDELDKQEPTRIDAAELDKLVTHRLKTLQTLAPAFPESFNFDGVAEDELYKLAFKNLTGSEPRDDADDAITKGIVIGYLQCHKDMAEEESPEGEDEPDDDEDEKDDTEDRGDSVFTLRTALRGAGRVSKDPASTYRKDQAEAWKRPLTASRK